MSEDAKVFSALGFGVIIIICLGFWGVSVSCDQRAVSFEDHKWGFLSGCMVKHNGKWLPLDNIRGFDDN